MIVYQSKYQTILYFQENQFLKQIWFPSTTLMDETVFKLEMNELVQKVFQHLPSKILINSIDLDFVIGEELQNWVNIHVNFPVIEKIPTLRSVFVMPKDLIAKLSLMQSVDDNHNLSTIAYFDNEAQGIDWLNNI